MSKTKETIINIKEYSLNEAMNRFEDIHTKFTYIQEIHHSFKLLSMGEITIDIIKDTYNVLLQCKRLSYDIATYHYEAHNNIDIEIKTGAFGDYLLFRKLVNDTIVSLLNISNSLVRFYNEAIKTKRLEKLKLEFNSFLNDMFISILDKVMSEEKEMCDEEEDEEDELCDECSEIKNPLND